MSHTTLVTLQRYFPGHAQKQFFPVWMIHRISCWWKTCCVRSKRTKEASLFPILIWYIVIRSCAKCSGHPCLYMLWHRLPQSWRFLDFGFMERTHSEHTSRCRMGSMGHGGHGHWGRHMAGQVGVVPLWILDIAYF